MEKDRKKGFRHAALPHTSINVRTPYLVDKCIATFMRQTVLLQFEPHAGMHNRRRVRLYSDSLVSASAENPDRLDTRQSGTGKVTIRY